MPLFVRKFFSNGSVKPSDEYEAHTMHLLSPSPSSTENLILRPCVLCEGKKRARSKYLSYVNVGLFLLNLLLVTISTLTIFLAANSRKSILKQSSFYSPVFDRFDIPTQVKIMNGSFFASDTSSIFRKGPSLEVDEAWTKLLYTSTILISTDDVKKLGKDPSLTVRAPEGWGYGKDKHLAQIDSQHQLHCLDMLRKSVYRDYYYPGWNDGEGLSPKYWTHVSHCIDILRQNLACNSNVDIITYNWVETQRYPYPDFGIRHQCRDHERIVEWLMQEENHVDQNDLLKIEKPEGAKELPIPPEYFDIFGVDKGMR